VSFSLCFKDCVGDILPGWLFLPTACLLGVWGFYALYAYSALLGISLLLIVWGTDIGAYVSGKIIGGPKLAPRISPNKTWAGAIGGLIIAGIIASSLSLYFYKAFNTTLISFYLACSLLGQIGDLLESLIKVSLIMQISVDL